MTVLEIYEQHGALPNSFVIEGQRFETTTMQHSDGVWYAYIYEMKGTRRVHLYSFTTGKTEKEAIENLLKENTKP